jgi:hypothetical protein
VPTPRLNNLCPGNITSSGASLLGKFEVGIAGQIRRLHRLVTRQHAGDSVLLLRPIEIGNAPARWRLNQRSQPNTRAKNVSRIAWLTAAGAALKGREDRAVAAVTTDGEIGEASRQVEV